MRKVLIGVALLLVAGPGAALALDGSVGIGFTFTDKGVRPFAGMEGGHESGDGSVYDRAWISGPSSNGRGGGRGSPGGSGNPSGAASANGLGMNGAAGAGLSTGSLGVGPGQVKLR